MFKISYFIILIIVLIFGLGSGMEDADTAGESLFMLVFFGYLIGGAFYLLLT